MNDDNLEPFSHTVVTPARKARTRLSKVANAKDTIAGFEQGMSLVALVYGQFSMIDFVEATLNITGPADVTISTWAAGYHEIEALKKLRDSNTLTSIRILMDSSIKKGQASVADVIAAFGPPSVRGTRSHAKFVLISNADWNVSITSSMNLNLNSRLEHLEMSDDIERAQFFTRFIESVWKELPEGDWEDRKLPSLNDLEEVKPRLSIRTGGAIRTGK